MISCPTVPARCFCWRTCCVYVCAWGTVTFIHSFIHSFVAFSYPFSNNCQSIGDCFRDWLHSSLFLFHFCLTYVFLPFCILLFTPPPYFFFLSGLRGTGVAIFWTLFLPICRPQEERNPQKDTSSFIITSALISFPRLDWLWSIIAS